METVIEKRWQSHGLDCMVVRTQAGHRCGYVRTPAGHPFCGVQYFEHWQSGPKPEDRDLGHKNYPTWREWYEAQAKPDDYSERLDGRLEVHGGVTFAGQFTPEFAEGWWIGFDCAHLGDEHRGWTTDAVAAEVESLARQVAVFVVIDQKAGV